MRSLPLLIAAALFVGCKKTVAVEDATTATESPAEMALDTRLAVDPTLRTGVLDNGMTYYVEYNRLPENKAVFRLAVDAGSILEDDDQLGVAHFLEHMAFNGTKSFPSNELIRYLEGVGTKFGPHLNAHTGFEETVYKLTVPSEDEVIFDKGLQILQEWACCLTLDPEEIEKERGVVLEEWRTREGVSARRTKAVLANTFYGSPYPDRLPIGTDESLKTFDPAVVSRFYKDWYRPDLMAVIVVGDVDVDVVEAKLQATFGAIAPASEPRERKEFELPDHEEHLYDVFVDTELTETRGWTLSKHDMPRIVTWGDLVERQHERIAISGFQERLSDLARNPEAPFLRARGQRQRVLPREGLQEITYTAKEGRVLEAYELALTELKRFQDHGLTQGEFDRAVKSRNAYFDKNEREANDGDSVSHANEIVRHFLQQEFMLGTVPESQLQRQAIQGVTLEDVNGWAAGFLRGQSRVTMVTTPEKEGITPPTVDDLKRIEATVAAMELEAPVDLGTIDALVAAPTAGSIVSEDQEFTEKLGFKGYTLSNGTKVYAKKTDFKAGEVLFLAFRKGGLSMVPDEGRAFATAKMTSRTRQESGLGEHGRSAVLRYLKGKTVRVSESFRDDVIWFSGSSSSDDLGVALELVHGYHVAPAFTANGTGVTKEVWRDWLKNYFNDPGREFTDGWDRLLLPDDPRSPQLLMSDVENLTPEDAREIWKASLGSPEEWTWAFVGDLPDDFETQIEGWMASIPKAESGYAKHDRGFRWAVGEQRKVIEAGTADRAQFRTVFHGELGDEIDDATWRVNFDGFGDVLAVKLREKLREDLGGVYGVSAWSSTWLEPVPGWQVRVDFKCDPARVEELEAAMLEVMTDLQKNGVEASYIEAEINKNREAFEDSQQNNRFWMQDFMVALQRGRDPRLMLDYLERDKTLTADKVSAFAKKYLRSKNHATLILMPGVDEE